MDAYTALLEATDAGHFTSIRKAVETLMGYMEEEQIRDMLEQEGIADISITLKK